MQLHPTRSAVDVAAAAMAVVVAGAVFRQPAVVAWGGALLVGLAIARAVTLVAVARIRSAGFEMLWRERRRVLRVGRGLPIRVVAEVRNRDTRAARFVGLRAVAAPELDVKIEPSEGEVPAGGRLVVSAEIRGQRVGRHGVHGLSLEVQGGPGLFEVPLTFANPLGVEVLPAPFAVGLRSARGGRSRAVLEAGQPGRLAGEGSEIREIREHQPGDPFKRIAWKAYARRGVLLVREHEREERDVVWLVLDASIELLSGLPGKSPLDHAIDEVAAVAIGHLGRGDRVGLAVIAARELCWLLPDNAPGRLGELQKALLDAASTMPSDRSGLDESDVALRVLEHLRPLDPLAVRGLSLNHLDRLASRAERHALRAPFVGIDVPAPERRERVLRSYLAAFGAGGPPRLEPDRRKTDARLAEALRKILQGKPRASVVYVWSPPPDPLLRPDFQEGLRSLPRRHAELRWAPMHAEKSVARDGSPVVEAVADAVALRARVSELAGERALRKIGVRIERVRPRVARPIRPSEERP